MTWYSVEGATDEQICEIVARWEFDTDGDVLIWGERRPRPRLVRGARNPGVRK